jgi:hypothetical protein
MSGDSMTTHVDRFTRRRACAALAGAFVAAGFPAGAARLVRVTVHRDPSCGCCIAWSERLRAAGFAVEVIDEANMTAVKQALGAPQSLVACHTAEVDGYVIEGHVPPAAIWRLLAEKPLALGLAVPGMPVGSAGMETDDGAVVVYDVLLFDASGQQSFGRYRGDQPL